MTWSEYVLAVAENVVRKRVLPVAKSRDFGESMKTTACCRSTLLHKRQWCLPMEQELVLFSLLKTFSCRDVGGMGDK